MATRVREAMPPGKEKRAGERGVAGPSAQPNFNWPWALEKMVRPDAPYHYHRGAR